MLRTKPEPRKLEQRRCLGCNVVSDPWGWCPKCMQKRADTAMGRPVVVESKQKAAEAAKENKI